jgi:hexosaminidase
MENLPLANYAIIPKPVSVQYKPGIFQCAGLPSINAEDAAGFLNEARVFADQLRYTWGGAVLSGGITLRKIEGPADSEAYQLEIDAHEIQVNAAAGAGMYRGLQTLRQLLLSAYCDGGVSIPCGSIEDRPRFGWRGFMLDCSRYFYSIEFIRKLLDALSLHHINIFHWHLTDDQGWRLPVTRYPLLAEIGGYRKDRRFQDRLEGGFYTEDDIRGIVVYAAERHIEVVPEVDLPGHASAILAAYPGLGCTGGPYQVEDRFGIFEDVLCAGNAGVFTLAEAVFDTLAELFPSRYVHIGGDEVLFNRWAACPKCRKRLAELGLSAPGELQGWITSRLAGMLGERGKTAIGWDEVLENGGAFPLPQDLIIMSWRGSEGGSRAAAQGRRVIMTPNTGGCYLDYKHEDSPEEPGQLGVNSVAQCYAMDPLTPEMGSAAPVLGGQGNLWSELVYADKIAEYMIFPRICALAESFWSDRESKNYEDFTRRLGIHRRRLDLLDMLQYRPSHGKIQQRKLFIFDMGGVAVRTEAITPLIAARLGISEADFFRGAGSDPTVTHTSPYHLGDIAALMRGEMDSPRFWSNFTARTGIAVDGDPWYDFFDPILDEGTAELIRKLRSSGGRVVCGTNTMDAHYRKHLERGDYMLFDEVYASHLMGIIKPDAAFWRYILEKENVPPDAAFFTDDFEENIHTAEKVGIHAHLFISAEDLKRHLMLTSAR